MKFNKAIKNLFIVLFSTLLISACSTAKKSVDTVDDVYTGTDTVEFLAKGVPDRIFFATNLSLIHI